VRSDEGRPIPHQFAFRNGRNLELAKLKELARLDAPGLDAIKGRPRVSKIRLATDFAAHSSGRRSILITDMAPDEKVTAADEREDFASQQR
jgi:hypothetical protein